MATLLPKLLKQWFAVQDPSKIQEERYHVISSPISKEKTGREPITNREAAWNQLLPTWLVLAGKPQVGGQVLPPPKKSTEALISFLSLYVHRPSRGNKNWQAWEPQLKASLSVVLNQYWEFWWQQKIRWHTYNTRELGREIKMSVIIYPISAAQWCYVTTSLGLQVPDRLWMIIMSP